MKGNQPMVHKLEKKKRGQICMENWCLEKSYLIKSPYEQMEDISALCQTLCSFVGVYTLR